MRLSRSVNSFNNFQSFEKLWFLNGGFWYFFNNWKIFACRKILIETIVEKHKQVVTQKQELKNDKINFEGNFWSVSTVYILL